LKRGPGALLAASAVIPWAAWYVFVRAHTPAFAYDPSHIPFASIGYAALHPTVYPAGLRFMRVIQLSDFVALAGAVLALALGVAYWRFSRREAVGIAALLFTAIGALVQGDDVWMHLCRVVSPLLIILISKWMTEGRFIFLAPTLLMLPRALVHLGHQAAGVLRMPGG
jgi:hypothetical protein